MVNLLKHNIDTNLSSLSYGTTSKGSARRRTAVRHSNLISIFARKSSKHMLNTVTVKSALNTDTTANTASY